MWRIVSKEQECREHVQRMRQLIDEIHEQPTPEAQQSQRNRLDARTVSALEQIVNGVVWRNGNGGGEPTSVWASLMRPEARPLFWLLVGVLMFGMLTGQIHLGDLFHLIVRPITGQ